MKPSLITSTMVVALAAASMVQAHTAMASRPTTGAWSNRDLSSLQAPTADTVATAVKSRLDRPSRSGDTKVADSQWDK
jgi:hypothetical protein